MQRFLVVISGSASREFNRRQSILGRLPALFNSNATEVRAWLHMTERHSPHVSWDSCSSLFLASSFTDSWQRFQVRCFPHLNAIATCLMKIGRASCRERV